MALVTIIGSTTGDDVSPDIEVTGSQTITVGLFANGQITERVGAIIYIATPSDSVPLLDDRGRMVTLTNIRPTYKLNSSGSYYVEKPITTQAVGVFYDNGQFGG
jgi:hypothetical protein